MNLSGVNFNSRCFFSLIDYFTLVMWKRTNNLKYYIKVGETNKKWQKAVFNYNSR